MDGAASSASPLLILEGASPPFFWWVGLRPEQPSLHLAQHHDDNRKGESVTTVKCAKCGASSFQADNVQLTGMGYEVYVVYCSSCRSPVGVMDREPIGRILQEQKRAIEELSSNVRSVANEVQQMARLSRR